MGILHDALRTYDANSNFAGVYMTNQREPLCPVSHMIQKAQLEITVSEDGSFISASVVDRINSQTIIPATEASSIRAGKKVAPHPLCDQIMYVAPLDQKNYSEYMAELTAWAESEYTHPLVNAVAHYAAGKTLITDLASCGIVLLNDDGSLTAGKIGTTAYEKCLIRWRLQYEDGSITESWTDIPLMNAYQSYYKTHYLSRSNIGICSLTGENVPLTKAFDKGLIPWQNGAKLISTNDTREFTFRGERWTRAEQAAAIGYEASQKAHRALRWLITNNGVNIAERTYICWNPNNSATFDPLKPLVLTETPCITLEQYQEQVSLAIKGHQDLFIDGQDIIVAAFDAATTGRLAVVSYNNLPGSVFFQNIRNWYESCCWPDYFYGILNPPLMRILNYAFGAERASAGRAEVVASAPLLKNQIQRLYDCISLGSPIPAEFVQNLAERASMPLNYNNYNRNILLTTACAVIRKFMNDRAGKEIYSMQLDETNQDRSYLFGRLLAIYEKIERDTYHPTETREPTAIRLQRTFVCRPMDTLMSLSESANIYLSKQVQPRIRAWYRDMIDQIMITLNSIPQEELNRPLKPTYLMGYSLQRQELRPKKKANTYNDENDD